MQQKNFTHHRRVIQVAAVPIIFAAVVLAFGCYQFVETNGQASTRLAPDRSQPVSFSQFTVREAVRNDVSQPFAKQLASKALAANFDRDVGTIPPQRKGKTRGSPKMPGAGVAVEQKSQVIAHQPNLSKVLMVWVLVSRDRRDWPTFAILQTTAWLSVLITLSKP
jgi:hypothetical protein